MSKTASAPYHVVRTICREHGTEGGFMSAKEYSSDPAIHLGPYSLVVFRSLDLFIVQASGNAPRSRGAVPGTDRYRLACLSSELPDQIDPLSGSSGRAAPGDNRLRQRHTDAREFRLRPPCRLYSPTVG